MGYLYTYSTRRCNWVHCSTAICSKSGSKCGHFYMGSNAKKKERKKSILKFQNHAPIDPYVTK